MLSLGEIDTLEVIVIVDNEVDPLSTYRIPGMKSSGGMADISARTPLEKNDRKDASMELRANMTCCGAHGLSLMLTATRGDVKHTVLFDTGPEESAWERNANRLKADIGAIELIHLSHWHWDHSGGMLRAISMINDAKSTKGKYQDLVVVDLHPSRPQFRGLMAKAPISMEADPTFEEIEAAGGVVQKYDEAHTVLDNMFLISGEIPRVTSYERGLKGGIRFNGSTWESDEMITDERFLMCNLKGKGLIMFTGCSHAGVVNASKHAVEVAGGSVPLYAVMGGYHLVGPNEPQIPDTVRDLKELDPKILLPGHCSGWRAKFEIEREMPGRLAPSTVGTQFVF